MGIFDKYLEDPLYWIGQRNVAYQTGKLAAHEIAHPLGETVAESVRSAISPEAANQVAVLGGGVLGHALSGIMMVGLVSGVSAGLTQFDYYRARNNIKDFYKEELAATGSDLDMVAAKNKVLDEELRKQKRERNFGIGFSLIASMVSLSAVLLLPVVTKAVFGVDLSPAASLLHNHTMAGLGSLALSIAVSLGVYNAVKIPVHWIGDKLFGLDKETTHERIVELQREHAAGHQVTREQVLSVFVSAHPELGQMITKQYGLPFDELAPADKQRAAEDIGKLAPIDHLTAEINHGRINVSELAFAAQGQISGVHHDRMDSLKQPGRLHKAWHKVSNALHFKPHPKVDVVGMSLPREETIAANAVAYAEAASGISHVERLGRSKFARSVSYVQQLEQQPAQNAPTSQSIQ